VAALGSCGSERAVTLGTKSEPTSPAESPTASAPASSVSARSDGPEDPGPESGGGARIGTYGATGQVTLTGGLNQQGRG
jgi:hypothetical protein